MLLWTEKIETGHTLIDAQHKMLFTYINRLEEMLSVTNPSLKEVEFCLELVNFIEKYAAVHFVDEEGCMESHRCPVRQENKAAHQTFLQFFHRFKSRFHSEGCRPQVLGELHQACAQWIEQHILQIDVQLKPCLNRSPTS